MLFDLFKRGPDSTEIARVLNILAHKSGEWGMQQLAKDNSDSSLLVSFVLVATGDTASTLIREVRGTASKIGSILQETRAYYDCLWQMHLLDQCNNQEERQKVSRLYAEVSLRTAISAKAFYNTYPELFTCAFDGRYDAVLESGVVEYIQGQREFPIPESDDLLVDNTVAYSFKVLRAAALPRSSLTDVLRIAGEATEKALSLKCLAHFDFKRCPGYGLPDSWLKPR